MKTLFILMLVSLCIFMGSVSAVNDSDMDINSTNVLNGNNVINVGVDDSYLNSNSNGSYLNSNSTGSYLNQGDDVCNQNKNVGDLSGALNDVGNSTSNIRLNSSLNDSKIESNMAISNNSSINSTNNANIKNSSVKKVTINKVTIANIIKSASTFRSYVLKYNQLPSNIKVGAYTVSVSQFGYLLSMAVKCLNSGQKTTYKITIKSLTLKTSSYSIKYNIKKSAYVKLAKKVISSCNSKGMVLSYVTVGKKKVSFKVYTFALAKCLVWYKSHKYLPKTCLLQSDVFVKKVTVAQVMRKAVSLKSYILKNKRLPSYITVGNYKLTSPQFTHLMAVSIKYIYAGKKTNTKITVWSVTNKSSSYFVNKKVSKANYMKLVNKMAKYKVFPSYLVICSKKIDYMSSTYAFSKILVFYKSYKYLPKTCLLDRSVFSIIDASYYSCIDQSKITTIYLSSDNIQNTAKDKAMLNTLKSTLTNLGYKVVIIGVGPNMHNKFVLDKNYHIDSHSLLIACFGGVDVGCIEEWSGVNKPEYKITPWFYNSLNGGKVLGVFYNNPYGACSNINSRIGKAWDSTGYGYPLDNPAKFMKEHGVSYIQTGSVNKVCEILKYFLKK